VAELTRLDAVSENAHLFTVTKPGAEWYGTYTKYQKFLGKGRDLFHRPKPVTLSAYHNDMNELTCTVDQSSQF
jgi:hypothetical protein